MHNAPMAHVAPALSQLRSWVTMCCLALGAAAIIQLIVFASVHFTDARWAAAERADQIANARIVLPAAIDPAAGASGTTATRRALGPGDATLKGFSRMAVAVGTGAALILATMTILGVVVGASGSVPGTERVVNAAVWATVLAFICLPWAEMLRGEALPGALASYESVTGASESFHAIGGGFALACRFVLLPLFVLAAATVVAWQFRSGVERGAAVSMMTEVEQAIATEMADVRARGGGSLTGGVRSVGALNRVLSEPEERPMRLAAGAESLSDGTLSASLLRKPGNQSQTMRPTDEPPPPPMFRRPV